MNPGRRKGRYAGILAGSLILLSSFLNPCSAEEKNFNVTFRKQEYNVSLDEENFSYSIEPDADKNEKEILASALIENSVSEIKGKREVLEQKVDEFLQKNPSRFELMAECKDVDFKISNSNPIYTEQPKINITAEREGNKLQVKWIIESDKYFLKWRKNSGIIWSYPEGTRILRRFDRIYELDLNSRDEFGKPKIKEVSFSEEREVAGMLVNSLEEKLRLMAKEELGVPAQVLIAGMEIEAWLANQERNIREHKIKSRIRKRTSAEYQPTASMPDGFQSPFEVGRAFSLEFYGDADKIDFFINSNLYPSQFNQENESTSSVREMVLLKMISAYINEPTEKTASGKIVKLGRTIEARIDEILREYKKRKPSNLDEKSDFYYKLKIWNAQVYPFVTLIEGLKERRLAGDIEGIPEYGRFLKDTKGIQDSIRNLENVLIIYKDKKTGREAFHKLTQDTMINEGVFRNESDNKHFLRMLKASMNYYAELIEKGITSRQETVIVPDYIRDMGYGSLVDGIFYRKTDSVSDSVYEFRNPGKDNVLGTDDDIRLEWKIGDFSGVNGDSLKVH